MQSFLRRLLRKLDSDRCRNQVEGLASTLEIFKAQEP